MSNGGISIEGAMKKWHLTEAQARELDKMDGDADNGQNGNGKISGTIFDMAESYFGKAHKKENRDEANRANLFNNFVDWAKNVQNAMNMMNESEELEGIKELEAEAVLSAAREESILEMEISKIYEKSSKLDTIETTVKSASDNTKTRTPEDIASEIDKLKETLDELNKEYQSLETKYNKATSTGEKIVIHNQKKSISDQINSILDKRKELTEKYKEAISQE